MCDGYHTHIVDGHLMLDFLDIDRVRFAKVHDILHACIQEHAVHIWMCLDDSGQAQVRRTQTPLS